MSDTQQLLWEVGCEELPAWACEQLAQQVPGLVREELESARLLPVGGDGTDSTSAISVLVGPRRFAVIVDAVQKSQTAVREERKGPAERAAFGEDGAPTQACAGFARSLGLAPDQLERRDGFVWGVRDLPSALFADVWPELAQRILQRINFAKPMKWGSFDHRFVRPIRWVVTLLGTTPVEYEVWGVRSGNVSRTHRFLGALREVTIPSVDRYESVLASGFVIADQHERRRMIEDGLHAAASAMNGEWFDPAGVLREVVHLVEHPSVITGQFRESYLQLPERVLITATQSHQRYLPVRSANGTLAPVFLAVMNGDLAGSTR